MPQVMISDGPITTSRLRLLWDDSRCLNVYVTATAAIAVWLKFATMAAHWGRPGLAALAAGGLAARRPEGRLEPGTQPRDCLEPGTGLTNRCDREIRCLHGGYRATSGRIRPGKSSRDGIRTRMRKIRNVLRHRHRSRGDAGPVRACSPAAFTAAIGPGGFVSGRPDRALPCDRARSAGAGPFPDGIRARRIRAARRRVPAPRVWFCPRTPRELRR